MKVYLVGGAVRDSLLGVPPKDQDYVVVGSSPEEMLSLGYSQVGADFPVFLHPETGEEYALARTERKVGLGYTGFESAWKGVTLEEDLLRRDLTINAIAQDLETGKLIDPYNGILHILDRTLNPVSEAFKEDPIRVLRVGVMLSRHPQFVVSEDLEIYCKDVAPELDFCAKERIWSEMEKALKAAKPSNFFNFLSQFNVFPIWNEMSITPQKLDHHPENWVDLHTSMVMDLAAGDPEVVFASLCHDFGKPECHSLYGNAFGHEEVGLKHIESFCNEYKVPNKYRDLALMVCKQHTKVHSCMGRSTNEWMKPKSIMKLFEETRALQSTTRFRKMLMACKFDAKGRGSNDEERSYYLNKPYPQAYYLDECLRNVLALDTAPISQKLLDSGKSGITIGLEIRAARINKIREVQNKWKIMEN